MNKAIVSARYPRFAERLQALGYTVVYAEEIPCEIPYERCHADLQCLPLDDTAFVLSCCQRLCRELAEDHRVIACEGFGGSYPDNVALSAVRLGKRLICRVPSLHRCVREYGEQHGYELIHVNQGYAKCSCAVASDNAVITADEGIWRALNGTDVDVLKIGQGSVLLDGADTGFIGGASGYDRESQTLCFCGNIAAHPDHQRIEAFCAKHHTSVVSLSDEPLTDIGGIIFC